MEKQSPSPIGSLRLITAAIGLTVSICSASAGTVTDDFDLTHDYSGGNVAGTIWTGLLNSGNASAANANASNAGKLTLGVAGNSLGFDSGNNDAPFLYIEISGDFEARVQIASSTVGNYSVASLMARGAPTTVGGSNNGENFVSLNLNNFTPVNTARDLTAGIETNLDFAKESFFELTRSGNTFTLLTSGDGITYTQRDSFTRPDLAGQSLQVGLSYGTYSGLNGSAQFDHFSLSGTAVPEPSTYAIGLTALLGAVILLRRRSGFSQR